MADYATPNRDRFDAEQAAQRDPVSAGPQQWAPPGNIWDPTNSGNLDPIQFYQQAMGVPFYPRDATDAQVKQAAGWGPVSQRTASGDINGDWGSGGWAMGRGYGQTSYGQPSPYSGLAGALQTLQQGQSVQGKLVQTLLDRQKAGLIPPDDQPTGLLAGGLASANR